MPKIPLVCEYCGRETYGNETVCDECKKSLNRERESQSRYEMRHNERQNLDVLRRNNL